jgi:uncharacterized protein with HEPN domain
MSRHDEITYLRHMLDHAREAVELSVDKTRSSLNTERTLVLSLTRLVEIIGEAASRVSTTSRDAHPEIRWRAAIGMRNRLIHGYDRVDLDVLWETVTENLPPLIAALEKILNQG